MNENKFSLGPALAQFRKLASKHNTGSEAVSEVEPMPRAEPLSQGGTEVTKQSEDLAELEVGLEPSRLNHVPMELLSQGQKRQQPEPEDNPEHSSHQPDRPLQRLRNSSPEEAAVNPPIDIPSSLEDNLSSQYRTEASVDGANQEADERTPDEDSEENGDEAREEQEEHNTPEGEWRANDTICPQCDDGGALLLCDGGCMRAFHAGAKLKETEEEVSDDEFEDDLEGCNPLSIGAEVFTHFQTTNDLFECPNCSSHIHQCFVCKQEGISDPADPDRNVYRCLVATCGRYYHARCLEKTDEEAAALLICPSHTCSKCKDTETEEKGEVIQCRRCPVGYHVGCLPKVMLKSPVTRVWITRKYDSEGNPLPAPMERSRAIEPACEIGQSLLYCIKHPMKVDDATPEHVRPLFTRALKRAWVKKCAQRYPDLAWSKQVMEKVAEVAKARQEAAERKRLQAAQEAEAARAPKAAKKGAAAKPAASAVAAAAGAPRRPASAKPKPGPPAKKADQPTRDDEDVPLAQRIAAAKRKQAAKASGSKEAEVSFIPLEDDAPGDSISTMHAPKWGSKHSRTRSVSAARPTTQQSSHKKPALPGELSAASVQAAAQEAAGEGSERSRPALPAALLDAPEAADESAPPSPGRGAAEAAVSAPAPAAAASATASQPEDDMWSPDADEDADEAAREDAQAAAEAAPPDAAAEQDALECAAEVAAAAASADEESFLLPCERESHWTRTAIQERLNIWFGDAEHANPFARVKAAARKPEPYNMPPKQTVAQDRLNILMIAVHSAEERPLQAATILTVKGANEMYQHEDNLRMVLAPLLHGESYTSYGRHFTLPPLLEEVNRYLMPFLRNHDTVVDFSCGYNVWVPMLKRMCLENGWEIQGKSFDIITSKDIEDFTKDTWFNVKPGQLGPPDRLVIGLNPPFGKEGVLANKFVERAVLYHQPRIIVLVVPPETKVPDGYVVVLEDTELMRGEAFFKPGVDKASWNDTTPSTRILVRHDHFEQARYLAGPNTNVIFEHAFQQQVPLQQMHMYNQQMPLPVEHPMYNMAF